ncbi:MAG: DUF4876 domain-containing protein [Caldithrix sp.]|nr:DUF4876 domain-containing protein [Caldithrix sp.]
MNRFTITIVIWNLTMLAALVACRKPMPISVDGSMQYTVFIQDDSGLSDASNFTEVNLIEKVRVTLTSNTYYSRDATPDQYTVYTDQDGKAVFDRLSLSSYNVLAEREVKISDAADGVQNTVFLRAVKLVNLNRQTHHVDTLKIGMTGSRGLMINEIYFCGPVNDANYVHDQFIELYNASGRQVHLDGMMFCKTAIDSFIGMDSVDYVKGIWLYQFPGQPLTGLSYPLNPGEFAVIAIDAYDHTQFIASSIDLRKADWEFFNPYQGDYDSPAPNIINIIPESSNDFFLSTLHGGLILTDGSEWQYGDYNERRRVQYVHIPINTVIDAVEYSSSRKSAKLLTYRVDAGLAGFGATRYSGKSTERRLPGFDSNNSTLDFETINHPTPGY